MRRDDKLLLVSGSRDWDDEAAVLDLLGKFDPYWTLVIHGKCRTGADAIADRHARRLGFTVVCFPADWRPGGVYNPGAGPKRNRQMVLTGIANQRWGVQVHAGLFLLPQSKGARGTYELCQLAGFDLHIYGSLQG